MKDILQVKNVSKVFTSKGTFFKRNRSDYIAVNNVSFSIQENESFGLVGESGSGKTTLAHIIAGLIEANSGMVLFDDENISNFSFQDKKKYYESVQMIFQDSNAVLNPNKTIGWSIGEGLRNMGKFSQKEIRKKVEETLSDVGLDISYYDSFPNNLSGGQRQRVSIASAIIIEPKFIIIDEGVSALDVSIQASILNLLNLLKKKYQLTYLLISHDLNVIEYFCDRVAVMYRGDLIEIFDPLHTHIEERNAYTQKLFASIPNIYLKEEV